MTALEWFVVICGVSVWVKSLYTLITGKERVEVGG